MNTAVSIFERQAGVARFADLRQLGFSPARLNRKIEDGEWQRVGRSVVVTSPAPLTAEQREWASVAAAGQGAALCGVTAAAHHGLKGFDDDKIHVVVPRGSKPRRNPLPVVIHESRRFDPATDVDSAQRPPMTRLERSVIDAATWAMSRRAACAVIIAAIAQNLTTAPALRHELTGLGQVRHHRILDSVLADIAEEPGALRTIEMRVLLRRHSLPAPRSVEFRSDGDGRRRYLDVEITSRRGKSWLIEVDGAAHLITGTYWSDEEPPDTLMVAAESTLYLPAVDVYLDEIAVMTELHRILDD